MNQYAGFNFWDLTTISWWGTASWRGARDAIKANRSLFLQTFVVLAAVTLLVRLLTPALSFAASDAAGLHFRPVFSLWFWIVDIIGLVATSVVLAPFVVAVHRFVLLGEVGDVFADRARLIRFAQLVIILRLAFVLPSFLAAAIGSIFAVLGLVVAVISVRWVLSYPGAALDKPTPVNASMALTKGHWWYIVAAFICTFLPVTLLAFVASALVLGLFGYGASSLGVVGDVLYALVISAYTLIIVAAAAALSSELYRKFGGLGMPPAEPLEGTPG